MVAVDGKPEGILLPYLLSDSKINSLNALYSGTLLTMVTET